MINIQPNVNPVQIIYGFQQQLWANRKEGPKARENHIKEN